jgi:uncharacterized protein YaiE (UPF0345 family)
MFKKLLIIAWVGLVGLTVSCKGPQGDVGPQGEKGDAGAVGPAGPAGQDGEGSGSGAGSLIVFMDELEIDSTGVVTFGSDTYFEGASEEEIAAFEKGGYLVYAKSGGAYFPLPGYVLFSDEAISYSYLYARENLGLYFEIFQTSNAEVPTRKFEEIRVIVMPALNARLSSSVDWKNYNAAVAALGLKEENRKVFTR